MGALLLAFAALHGCSAGGYDRLGPSPAIQGPRTVIGRELDVRLSRGRVEGSPVLNVRITNVSAADVCLPADTIGQPWSYSVTIELREDGRPLRYGKPGFLDGPRPGEVILRPGASTAPYFYFANWFDLPEAGLRPRAHYQARIRFLYSVCGRSEKLTAVGGWQDI